MNLFKCCYFNFKSARLLYQLVSEQIQAQDMLRKSHTSSAALDKGMFMLALFLVFEKYGHGYFKMVWKQSLLEKI